ncbi:MAG: aminotransferase class I/II-fold pyridoxal phosphate-dependent enzyme [Bifidobacteriaceae bacterium]|jgi:OAH/OAS sulfhydrylase|nr:aminotransferase class I/II-fold pyridoxal phosphate-dependent enzyme [Bifidobacteriaceae bacterium]
MTDFATACVRAGYEAGKGEPVNAPIVQSTTFRWETTEQVHELFDLDNTEFFYSRIDNPTSNVAERHLSALEGGVGAVMTSSGQAANQFALLNILNTGDHVLCSKALYGGTINLFQNTLGRLGLESTFVDQDSPLDELQKHIRPNTKAVFAESISNPVIKVLDIEKFAQLAHTNHVPLIIDNTFATPYFCRPFEFGADIITHSTTKYLDGQAVHVGGMVIDSGNFDWQVAYEKTGKFAGLIEPDTTYKGMQYVKTFGNQAYSVKMRQQLQRDYGATPAPWSAFLLDLGIKTLHVRMPRHAENALALAQTLQKHEKVQAVHYPALAGDEYYNLAQKYMPKGASGVLAVEIKAQKAGESPRDAAGRFINALKLFNIEVHVADIRSCALHPASSTHRQLTDDELTAAGIAPGLVRLSVGLESARDIVADVEQALNAS